MNKFGKGEEIVMGVLWSSEDPLTASEIQKLAPEYSKAVVAEILRNLIKKEAIKIDDIRIVNKSLSRLYRPIITEEEYFSSIIPEKALEKLITNYINKNKYSTETRALYEMLHKTFSKEGVD